jgi:(p)ppGpp synthase/HD superfamily hydrolase
MLETAITIATKAFQGKTDKAGKPYVNHLYRVRDRVRKQAWPNEELETVAILHDILEDCPEWNRHKLLDHFPESVVASVECLTHRDGERYEDYIDRVLTNQMATLVKQADLEDNMDVSRLNELTDKDCKRRQKYLSAYHFIARP